MNYRSEFIAVQKSPLHPKDGGFSFAKRPAPEYSRIMHAETRTFLSRLKSRNFAANVPSVSEATGRFLYDLVRQFGAKKILELGTAHGYSTIWMAEALQECRDPESIITVDFSKPSFEAARANVEEAGFKSLVTHVFADALEYLPTIAKERFDFVFLDAEKRSTARLFELVWPMLSPGGTMVVDDVVKFRAKMEDFYALMEKRAIPYEIRMTDPDDGVMVIRKASS
jgi:predicted O-methyltransferase YrrM